MSYSIDETYKIIQDIGYITFCVSDIVDIMILSKPDIDRKKATSAVSRHLQRMAKQGYIEFVCYRHNGSIRCYEYRVV